MPIEATYGALAASVAVVTTPAAGSVVRDAIEGRTAPARYRFALADAIAGSVEDCDQRARMSRVARDYTWQRYCERRVTVLKTLGSAR